jgi:prolyl-tRNA editing enzyme YbaK/EbsC (Cys-tRNA(Pro) deacylase)
MSGESRLDNRKYKDRFGAKAKMLDAEEVLAATSHPVGGVCPIGLPRPLRVYADVSLRRFQVVVPAGGDTHHAMRIAPERLAQLANAEWVDVAQAQAAEPPSADHRLP